MKDSLILIDGSDNMIGTIDKMQAHVHGKLHRAFSVFIFNTSGQLLLQQRAAGKYHSAGLWTNTCCSHPMPGENTLNAANRRLMQEMGMTCNLRCVFNFTYYAELENGITEHELDYVFFGISDEHALPDTAEVAAVKYIDMDILAVDLHNSPERYTEWLKICFSRVLTEYYQFFKAYESLVD